MLQFSLLVYQQATASTASILPFWIMYLLKMTFELLFTWKQNSSTFVEHCNIFIHNLSIHNKHTCHSKDVAQKHWSRDCIDSYKTEKIRTQYFAYIDIWTHKVGDENFCLKSENQNQYDKFVVAIVLEERIVGHVPKSSSKMFHQFMKIPNCTIGCKVTGKRVNRGVGYDFEIPVQYRFIGAKKEVEWAEKNIKKVLKT